MAEMSSAGVAVALVGVAAAWFWQRRAQARFRARRASIFDDCRAVLQGAELISPGSDYPLLRGCFEGEQVMLQPLLDHVGYRKVPSLWLLITVDRPLPVEGRVDIVFRPANIEFFSSIDRLPERVYLGSEWPEHHMARVGPVGWRPPLAQMHAALGEAIDSTDLKEIVVTPKGIRLVVRVCGVERSHYMVLRSMLPELERIPSEWLITWLAKARSLVTGLQDEELERR